MAGRDAFICHNKRGSVQTMAPAARHQRQAKGIDSVFLENGVCEHLLMRSYYTLTAPALHFRGG
jgi:hypothetical protein